MAQPIPRSIFWIVSTHVITTGFVMPLLANLVAFAILRTQPGLDPWLQIGIVLGLTALGYLGGVYYSLGYIRKVALTDRPMACVTPSVITFAVCALGGLIYNAWSQHDLLYLSILVVYYTIITILFALATRQGFRQMAVVPQGFPVQFPPSPPRPVQSLPPPVRTVQSPPPPPRPVRPIDRQP